MGLAISQTLILTGMLQFGVRQTAEVISQMTSVERILQYTHIEREPHWEKGGTSILTYLNFLFIFGSYLNFLSTTNFVGSATQIVSWPLILYLEQVHAKRKLTFLKVFSKFFFSYLERPTGLRPFGNSKAIKWLSISQRLA